MVWLLNNYQCASWIHSHNCCQIHCILFLSHIIHVDSYYSSHGIGNYFPFLKISWLWKWDIMISGLRLSLYESIEYSVMPLWHNQFSPKSSQTTRHSLPIWGVFCEYNFWCIFCLSHCHTICKMMFCWTALYRYTTVHCMNCKSRTNIDQSFSVTSGLSEQSIWDSSVKPIIHTHSTMVMTFWPVVAHAVELVLRYIEGILPKGPYLPCISMAGRALLAGYPQYS